MTQKFDKSVRKMRGVLEEIQESRRVQMAKKVEEKTDLEAAGEEIRQRSRSIIAESRKSVDERVRAMAWKSHARQIKIGDVSHFTSFAPCVSYPVELKKWKVFFSF